MSRSSNTSNGGVGVVGLLWVALIVLKILGYITWSWWLVITFPIMAFVAVMCFIFLCFAIFVLLKKVFS